MLKILSTWGYEGFEDNVQKVRQSWETVAPPSQPPSSLQVRAFYVAQKDAFLQAARTHLTGLAEWNENITAGMFAWIKLKGIDDSAV